MARRIRPVDRLESIVDRLDRALSERDIGAEVPRAGMLSGVDADVIDEGDDVRVVFDLPGFDKGDISVEADEHRLRVEAEADEENEIDEDDYYRRERKTAKASRTLTLPAGVDPSGADASYEGGVLTVTLPKAEIEGGEDIDIS